MKRTRPTVQDVLLAMATTSATAGVLVALRAWWLAPAVALAALSPFFEWRPVPVPLVRPLNVALRLSLLLAFLVVWFTRPMPLLPDEPGGTRLVRPLAALLASLATVLVLARRTFPPSRTLVPALLALMVVASADPSPQGFGSSVVPAFRVAGHNAFAELFVLVAVLVAVALWAAALAANGPAWHGRDAVPLAALVLVCAALSVLGILGLPTAQPQVERVVAEALDRAATGLGSGSTLGEFDELAVSRRRVLDLRASQPTRLRLRAEILTHFDGRRWTADAPADGRRSLVPGTAGVADPLLEDIGPWFAVGDPGDASGLRLRVVRHSYEDWPLLLPRDVALVAIPTPWLERDGRGLLRARGSAGTRLYGAVLSERHRAQSTASQPPPEAVPDPADTAECLSLPPRVSPAVAALAQGVSRGATTAAERAERTVRYLQSHYRYTLQPGPFHQGGDPVAEFLFDKKEGYCEYFATAAALLLRLQGVPARFVKGFAVGPQNEQGGGLYVVRDSDAHAWVEVFVPGSGWTEMDPTPAGDFAAAHPVPTPFSRAVERVRAALAEVRARLDGPGAARFLHWLAATARRQATALAQHPAALAAVAGALAVWLLRARAKTLFARRRRCIPGRAGASVPDELRRAIDALEDRWSRLGRPRRPARGLREHARQVAAGAPGSDPAACLVDLYYRARFGGEAVSEADIRRVASAAIDRRPPGRQKRTPAAPRT